MRMPVQPADRRKHAPRHGDSDLERVRDVLKYYGSASSFSRSCAEDLTILIKMARVKVEETANNGVG